MPARRIRRSTLILLALLLAPAARGAAQEPTEVAGSSATTRAGRDSLLAAASRGRIKGAADAPVTVIEISDFQCPFCGAFARSTLAALDSAYVRTGQVRLVYLNYPLPTHHQAWQAAEAALCAGTAGAFWPMHDRIFAGQEAWSGSGRAGELFEGYAEELGLDPAAFRACTAGDLVAPLLLDDVMQVARSGVSATPTFILNGERVLSGALSFEELRAAIEPLLAR